MSDWSYHPIFKHLVVKLPGHIGRDLIHKGMSGISTIPGGNFMLIGGLPAFLPGNNK